MGNVQEITNTKSELVVAVVGSRSIQGDQTTAKRLGCYLAHLRPALVISGGAAGADQLAAGWARANEVPLLEVRPDYAAHGASAPHMRNAEIVRQADLVLLLWDGKSRGTLSAARAAARLGRRCKWLLHAPPAGPAGGLEL